MGEKDFALNGRDFKLSKINAFEQFHIVRKIGPILSELLPAIGQLQALNKKELSDSDKFDQMALIASPILNGLSKLSEEDSEKVLFGLLASVEMKQSSGNWAKVATKSMLMIQDLELPAMLNIASRAFAYNLSGFFDARAAISPAAR